MTIAIDGRKYHRTAEACRIVGISRSTFFRWLRAGLFKDVQNVDRRGWRLFSNDDLARLKAEVNQVRPNSAKNGGAKEVQEQAQP